MTNWIYGLTPTAWCSSRKIPQILKELILAKILSSDCSPGEGTRALERGWCGSDFPCWLFQRHSLSSPHRYGGGFVPAEASQSLNSNFPPKPHWRKASLEGIPTVPFPLDLQAIVGTAVGLVSGGNASHSHLARCCLAAPGLAPVPMPSRCHPTSTSSLWLSIGMKSFFSFYPSRHCGMSIIPWVLS